MHYFFPLKNLTVLVCICLNHVSYLTASTACFNLIVGLEMGKDNNTKRTFPWLLRLCSPALFTSPMLC